LVILAGHPRTCSTPLVAARRSLAYLTCCGAIRGRSASWCCSQAPTTSANGGTRRMRTWQVVPGTSTPSPPHPPTRTPPHPSPTQPNPIRPTPTPPHSEQAASGRCMLWSTRKASGRSPSAFRPQATGWAFARLRCGRRHERASIHCCRVNAPRSRRSARLWKTRSRGHVKTSGGSQMRSTCLPQDITRSASAWHPQWLLLSLQLGQRDSARSRPRPALLDDARPRVKLALLGVRNYSCSRTLSPLVWG
jgi:hypothetical protein